MVGPRNILLALAIVAAIAASSENAAGEQEDHLDALELCLDPFPCRTSPYSVPGVLLCPCGDVRGRGGGAGGRLLPGAPGAPPPCFWRVSFSNWPMANSNNNKNR